MSSANSLHEILQKDNWNLETISSYLEQDSINVKNSHGSTLLESVLRSKNCAVDVVKLLLQKGADVNYPVDKDGHFSPLVTAIRCSRDEEVIQLLLERGADVNEVHPRSFHETPLLILLRNPKCSSGAVKLLLRYGANVNCKDIYGYSPLTTALQNSRNDVIISMLLEAGAGVDALTNFKRSPLCIAFEHTSNDIVKLLLDAGCSPNACKYHVSALHCATQYSKMGLREDILKRLLEAGADVNFVFRDGQSVLCFALRNGAEAHDIELLLNEGASLTGCRQHANALACATGGTKRTPLKAAVMKLLCNIRFDAERYGLEVLQNALKYCNYETEAIQLLFDLPGMDAYVSDKSLLNHAVCNPNCKVDVLKLLVKDKSQLQEVYENDETLLHRAVKECKPVIVDFFLEKGAPVNAKNQNGETPLALAVKNARGSKIIKSLFVAGAQLSEAKCSNESSLLWSAFKQYHAYTVDEQACLKTLIKYFFLQNPESVVQDFMNASRFDFVSRQRDQDYSEYSVFANECFSELQKMKTMQVGRECTLRDIVSKDCLPEVHSATCDEEVKYYNFNQILRWLTENAFLVYFDDISAGIEKSVIETELQKLIIYTNIICPNSQYTKKVCLNNEIVQKIAELLPNQDAMKFLLAYRQNHTESGLAKIDNLFGASKSASQVI